jgi:hypothetical protein
MACREHHHIGWFQIAVNHALGVRFPRTFSDLANQPNSPWQIDLAAHDQFPGFSAPDVFHHQAIALCTLQHMVNLDDGRMIEPRRRPRLTPESRPLGFVSQPISTDALHRHMPSEQLIPSEVDLPHPSLPQTSVNAVDTETLQVTGGTSGAHLFGL